MTPVCLALLIVKNRSCLTQVGADILKMVKYAVNRFQNAKARTLAPLKMKNHHLRKN